MSVPADRREIVIVGKRKAAGDENTPLVCVSC